MNKAFELELVEEEHQNSLQKLESKLPKWKKIFFSLLNSLYHRHLQENISSLHSMLYYLQNFIALIQIASIIWTYDFPIQGWNDYRNLWKVLMYSRLDAICVESSFIQNCIYGTYSFYLALLFMLFLLFILKVFKKPIPEKLTFFTKKLLVLASVGNNSFFLLLMMILKYSWQKTTINEYTKTVSLDQGIFGILMSILLIIILIFICYCNITFNYDTKHINAHKSYYGKSTSKITKVSILVNYSTITFYCFISSSYYILYRGILIIIHSISAGMYCYYLPFYNIKANFIHSVFHVFVVISCFLSIIGYYINSTVFCILGLLLLFPISIALWFFVMNYRVNKIRILEKYAKENVKSFELVMRDRLLNPKIEVIDNTLKLLNNYQNKSIDHVPKMFTVWFASFCFYVCMNEKLAIVKLNTDSKAESSLEEDFQEYLLKREITKSISKSEEYQLLSKISQFEKLKKLDKKTLISVFTFLRNIVLKDPIQSNLEDLIKKFKNNLKKIMKLNTKLTIRFQDSIMFLEFYANFVDFILGDKEKAFSLNSRKNNLKKYQEFKDGKQNQIFSEENPLILTKNTGKIIYTNTHIEKLFKSSSVYFSEQHIQSIFPKSLQYFSHKQLKSFENKTLDSIKYLDANIGIIDSKGYWIEASISVLLVSLSYPIYMFICRPLNLQRQSVILDKNGIILERTEEFDSYNEDGLDVRGFNIEHVLKINFKDLRRNKNIEIVLKSDIIFVMYNKIKVFDSKIRVVSLYKTEESVIENEKNSNVKFVSCVKNKEKERKIYLLESKNTFKTNEETLLFDMNKKNHSPK
ncbi:hypothetical protein SteCoe_36827 [Stentor coeruleus]|uniref:Uncharacterized protein n=1 Tax=Stentor coeruleus TaxID=5963 RepID=A0A1R2APC8_9CILI|nr:hypothetical protein SteCoe_36827 [Stentor coeruleus]